MRTLKVHWFCDQTSLTANHGYEIRARLYSLLNSTRTFIAKAIGREKVVDGQVMSVEHPYARTSGFYESAHWW